jgi:hypothetical protein
MTPKVICDYHELLGKQPRVSCQSHEDRLSVHSTMTGQALFFTGERTVAVREIPIPEPGTDEVLVRTERSAVSPGTELLVYRDEVPDELAAD